MGDKERVATLDKATNPGGMRAVVIQEGTTPVLWWMGEVDGEETHTSTKHEQTRIQVTSGTGKKRKMELGSWTLAKSGGRLRGLG